MVRAIDGPVAPLPCLSKIAYSRCDDCPDEKACGTRRLFKDTFDVSKADGAMTRLVSKTAAWDVFGGAVDGNALELLGDTGSAWDIRYTGTNRILVGEGVSLQLLDDGPVFSRLRVTHALGHSTYSQDIVAYGALPRIDVPTKVDLAGGTTLLKVRFPLNATNLDAQAEIPFGSIHRPVNGQECPAQRWMADDWDGLGGGKNRHAVGFIRLVQCAGRPKILTALALPMTPIYCRRRAIIDWDQRKSPLICLAVRPIGWIMLTRRASGFRCRRRPREDTVYLLAVCVNRGRSADLAFQMTDGSVQTRIFPISDWVVSDAPDNEAGFTFADRQTAAGEQPGVATHLWVIPVSMP